MVAAAVLLALGLGVKLAPVALSITGNTAGTPSVISSGTAFLAGGPNITLSQDGRTISISAGAGAAGAGTGFTSATTAGTQVKGTLGTDGLSLGVPAFLTTAQPVGAYLTTAALSNHSHGNPTLALTNLTGTTASASDGLTLSLSAFPAQTVQTQNFVAIIGSGANGNGTFTSGTLSLKAGDNVTLSTGANVISIHAPSPAGGGAGTGFTSATTAGVEVKGTLGTDGLSLRVPNYITTARASTDAVGLNTALTANGVAWTVNSAGISLNVPAFLTTAAASNHSHGNPTLALTNLSGTTASNSAGFTLSLSADAPGGGAPVNRQHMEIMGGDRMTTCAVLNNGTYSNRPVFVPFVMKEGANLSCNTVQLFFSRTSGTALVATLGVAFYTYANATSINLAFSTTHNFSVQSSVSWSGIRAIQFTGLGANVLTAGEYVFALYNSAAASNSCALHVMGGDGFALAGYINTGTNQTAASHSQSQIIPMWGVWNATTAAFPAAVAFSSISGGMPSVNSPDIYAIVKE